MKIKFFNYITLLGLFFVLAVAGVQAQRPTSVEVNMPFDFTAGKATLKSGLYNIRKLSGNVVSISDKDGKKVIVSAPLTIGSRDLRGGARLVFNRYGTRYFLSQIWLTPEIGQQLFPTKTESRVRDSQVAQGFKPERIEITLRGN